MNDVSLRKQCDDIWQTQWTDMQKYGPVHRHPRRVYRFLLRSIPNLKLKSVLDIGCGSGDNLMFIKSLLPSIKAFGMDITDVPLKIAQTLIPDGTFWTDDIQNPKQTTGLFDLVTCFEVIENLEDDWNALNHICKIMNRHLLLSTPGGRMREVEREIGHYRNYEVKRLKEMLDAFGFRMARTIQWSFPFFRLFLEPWHRNPRLLPFRMVDIVCNKSWPVNCSMVYIF